MKKSIQSERWDHWLCRHCINSPKIINGIVTNIIPSLQREIVYNKNIISSFSYFTPTIATDRETKYRARIISSDIVAIREFYRRFPELKSNNSCN